MSAASPVDRRASRLAARVVVPAGVLFVLCGLGVVTTVVLYAIVLDESMITWAVVLYAGMVAAAVIGLGTIELERRRERRELRQHRQPPPGATS